MDSELLYQWFIPRLSFGEPQSVTGWEVDKELRGDSDPLEAPMEHLRVKERKNAITSAPAETGQTVLGEDLDAQPLDILAVTARPALAQRRGGGGLTPEGSAPTWKREQRTW